MLLRSQIRRSFITSPAPAPRRLLFLASRLRAISVILLLAWPLSACTSWQSLPAPQKGFGRDVGRVEVLTPSGDKLEVWYPELKGDSLLGAASPDRRGVTDIRLGNLRTLRIRRFSTTKTVFLVVGSIGIGALTAICIAAAVWQANYR